MSLARYDSVATVAVADVKRGKYVAGTEMHFNLADRCGTTAVGK